MPPRFSESEAIAHPCDASKNLSRPVRVEQNISDMIESLSYRYINAPTDDPMLRLLSN